MKLLINLTRLRIFALLTFIAPFQAVSQPEGYKLVTDTAVIGKKISGIANSTETINAQFIQEKNISVIEEKIISKGIILYQSPDKLRLEYTEPFTYLMVMNSGRMMTDNGNKKSEFDLKSNKMFGEINSLIISSVKGDILKNRNFKSRVYENPDNIFITLITSDAELAKYIQSIELFLNKKDYSVTELKIIENAEDFTLIRFTHKTINEEIPPESFRLY